MIRRLLLVPVMILTGLVAPAAATACNIPVFRYALERWRADSYEIVIFHHGPLAAPDQIVIDTLRKGCKGGQGGANYTIALADRAETLPKPHRQRWKAPAEPPRPWMVVRYPGSKDDEPAAWAGRLSAEAGQALVDSPARRELARRLLRGDSAVWLVLASGDQQADSVAEESLKTELAKLEKSLQLPEAAGEGRGPLLADVPLRIAFSALRVPRDDPAEKQFVAMLLGLDPDLALEKGPVVFPVFGRGRVLAGLAGKDLVADVYLDAATFLCGACSCQVKAANPGIDLLMATDWDAVLMGEASTPQERPAEGELVPIPRGSDPPARPGIEDLRSPTELDGALRSNSGPDKFLLVALILTGAVVILTGVWAFRTRFRRTPARPLRGNHDPA